MRSAILVLLAAASIGPLSAQTSTTLPAGLDSLKGGGERNRFDATKRFRLLVWFDQSTFPWGSAEHTITGFRLRRQSGVVSRLLDHTKTSYVRISVNGQKPDDTVGGAGLVFDSLHNKDNAVRSPADPNASVAFRFPTSERIPAAFQPDTGPAHVFEADFRLERPFVVPADATNLILEIGVFANQVPEGEEYPLDQEQAQDFNGNALPDRGGMRRIGEHCPPSPRPCVRFRGTIEVPCFMAEAGGTGLVPGARARFALLSGVTERNACWWLGPILDTPVRVPDSSCSVYVLPDCFLFAQTDDEPEVGRLEVAFDVPKSTSLIGQCVGLQFAVHAGNGEWPHGLGVSAGYELTIGTGNPNTERFRMVFVADDVEDPTQPLPSEGTLVWSTPVFEIY
jgi:hypothetical protein